MTGPDPSLPVPDPPALRRGLGSLEFPLQRAPSPGDDPSFRLAGERAHIEGGMARGIDRVEFSVCAAEAMSVGGGTVEAAVLTPVGLERRLRVSAAEVVERVVVSRSDPVGFLEWSTAADLMLNVSWTVPAPERGPDPEPEGAAEGLRWRAVGRVLVVAAAGSRMLYVLSDAPAELTVSRIGGDGAAAGLRVRAALAVGEDRAVRLAVAGTADDDDEDRVLRVMGRSHVVVPGRRAEARRLLDDRLALESPDDALSEAIEWAKVGLAGQGRVVDPGVPISSCLLRLSLASLAVGDPDPARRLLTAPPTTDDASDAPPDADDDARRLILAARYLAWTGDLRTMKAAWPAVRRLAESTLDSTDGPHDRLVRGALAELVPTAEEVGDEELADRLRSVGDGARPLAVADLPDTEAADPDSLDQPLRFATTVEAMVHELLGAEPDAPRGRLVLRPRFPETWDRCAVRRLAVGGAAVELEYAGGNGTHRYTLRQTRGGAPLRVIFEPEIEGSRVVAARVDGEAAELDAVAVDGRVRVPVQLVLDHERRVEVEIEGADA